jgi:hypothetical protein
VGLGRLVWSRPGGAVGRTVGQLTCTKPYMAVAQRHTTSRLAGENVMMVDLAIAESAEAVPTCADTEATKMSSVSGFTKATQPHAQ